MGRSVWSCVHGVFRVSQMVGGRGFHSGKVVRELHVYLGCAAAFLSGDQLISHPFDLQVSPEVFKAKLI